MMSFDSQPTLTGSLVQLRPLRADDYAALRAVASDPEIWAQHPESNRHEEAVFRRFFDDAIASGGALAAIDRQTARVIGSSRFKVHAGGPACVEIGWTFLARSHWGGRYNGEMKRLMIEHAFRFTDRVVFLVGVWNVRSQLAVERLGAARVSTAVDDAGRQSYEYEMLRPPTST